jgi:hypothetical protein
MFVKGPSGLCPSCFSNRPARPLEQAALPVPAETPFVPRLDATHGWQSRPLGRRFRELVQRSRRPGRAAASALALPVHADGSPLHTS